MWDSEISKLAVACLIRPTRRQKHETVIQILISVKRQSWPKSCDGKLRHKKVAKNSKNNLCQSTAKSVLCHTKGIIISFSACAEYQSPELGTCGISYFLNNENEIFCIFYQDNLTVGRLFK